MLSLRYVDLSKNQLTDIHGPSICALVKNSTINSLVIDHNQFKTVNFYESLCRNEFLEEFSVSFNPLGQNEVIGIIEAVAQNQTIKILGLQGYNNKVYDKVLSEALKTARLVLLKYDLDICDETAVRDIEFALLRIIFRLKISYMV
jgi:hypothetical protein